MVLTKEQMEFLVNKEVLKDGIFIMVENEPWVDYKILNIDKEYNLTIRDIVNEKDKVIPYTKICVIEDMTLDRIIQAYCVDDELSIIEINDKTDVKKDIIGVYEYVFKTSDGRIIELEDGMKIIFHNDANDKYRNKVLTVKGVGSSINLVAPRGRPKKNR
jgi:hypothetical protein